MRVVGMNLAQFRHARFGLIRVKPAKTRPRLLRVALLAVALLMTACVCPETASSSYGHMYAAVSPAIDEVPVFQAVRSAVTELQTALHRKVASVLIDKVADKVIGTSYESTWQVAVKYYLDYSKPEDVPYLKGMQKCLSECTPTAGKEWVTWAQAQISRARSAYADEIAFQQELKLAVAVTASLDESGGLVPASMKVLHAVSETEMVTLSAETLAAPSDSQMLQAGYHFLKDRLSSETQSSSDATQTKSSTPSTPSTPTTSSTPSTPSREPSKTDITLPSTSRNSEDDRTRVILQIGIGGLVVLVLLLVLNQRLLHQRKR